MDIRGILYWIFRCDPSDMNRWMKDKYFKATLIDIFLMYLVAIIFGLLVIKILIFYDYDMGSDMMKYVVIILTNLMVFFMYYMMHREIVDEYVDRMFDGVFDMDYPEPKGMSVEIPDEMPEMDIKERAKKKIKDYGDGVVSSVSSIKYKPLWGGATVFMGDNELFKI